MKKSVILLFIAVTVLSYGQRSDFIHSDFKKADSIAFLHKGASLANLPLLTYKLTDGLATDTEKFRALYTWVCTNIENDYSSYLRTSKKRKKLAENREAFLQWNNSFTPKVFEKLVRYRKTACTGYAYLICELASLADIDCKIINGYGRTATLFLGPESIPNHSWNAVKLNNKWYLCDATWSSGRIILEENVAEFKPDYHDGYFLADPALFIKNHYPLQIDWALLGEPPTFNQFLEGPVVYKEAFQWSIIPILPEKMIVDTKKNEAVLFKLAVPNTSQGKGISLLLKKGNSSQTVNPTITQNQKEYTLQYSFEKAGLHDVHIKMDSTVIATYVVKVRRK